MSQSTDVLDVQQEEEERKTHGLLNEVRDYFSQQGSRFETRQELIRALGDWIRRIGRNIENDELLKELRVRLDPPDIEKPK